MTVSSAVRIPLTQGKSALIDQEDIALVSAYTWYAVLDRKSGAYYACTKTRWPDGRRRVLGLHRLILNASDGRRVDHISGDTLDCRRNNLRFATASQNRANSRRNRNSSSKYRGVYPKAGRPRHYDVFIGTGVGSRPKYIGTSTDIERAAHMYDDAAKIAYGEFATLNFPDTELLTNTTDELAAIQPIERRNVRTDNSSGFRGVTRDNRVKGRDLWVAQISFNGKMRRIGSFLSIEQAARAYDAAARDAFGSQARLNFPDS